MLIDYKNLTWNLSEKIIVGDAWNRADIYKNLRITILSENLIINSEILKVNYTNSSGIQISVAVPPSETAYDINLYDLDVKNTHLALLMFEISLNQKVHFSPIINVPIKEII